MTNAIIIMVKVPEPGRVKTRLQPFLTPEQSAELAVTMLLDAETKAKSVTNDTIIAYSPPNHRDSLVGLLKHNHVLYAQNGRDLGERMHDAFEYAGDLGFENIVMIGTDSPSCPWEYLKRAFEHLERGSDVVLGKAKDGGFYLIGMKRPELRAFIGVEWGTSVAFDQTVGNIKTIGLTMSYLPVCADIDREEDLRELFNELSRTPELAPVTAAWIANHFSGDTGQSN